MSLHRLIAKTAALGLATALTLATLSVLDLLAVDQHAGAAMARAASAAAHTAAKTPAPRI